MIDSHAHLSMFDRAERGSVVARAVDAGIGTILVPATRSEDLAETLSVIEDHPESTLVAVGFHPHHASDLDAGWKRTLERALERPGVVAVGEIGLDYHYMSSPAEDQRAALRWQLAVARERSLPVVLHHREAWKDFLEILDEFTGARGVAHSFTEGADGADEMVRRGLHVGISGMVTFAQAENVRDAARAVPRDRLLVETDAPFLAPVPHRGKRNESALVVLVAEAVAAVRQVDVVTIERETDAAFIEPLSPSHGLRG